jgi:hypothetical protein
MSERGGKSEERERGRKEKRGPVGGKRHHHKTTVHTDDE